MFQTLLHNRSPRRLAVTFLLLMGAMPAIANTYTVTNTASSGAGSLDQAILDANAHPGADVINFNIASGPFVISPTAANPLHYIRGPVTIDGYSPSGASVATSSTAAVLKIEIDGSSASFGTDGLMLETGSDGSTIKGLVIRNFSGGSAIRVLTDDNTIEGCHLGTNAAGTAAQANDRGISLNGTMSNTIGGTSASARNVISGNTHMGIYTTGLTRAGSRVLGNYIGTTAGGNDALGNDIGIYVGCSVNIIGESTAGSGNVISGNTPAGMLVEGTYAEDNFISGNTIGMGADGNTAVMNGDGIHLSGAGSTRIGGIGTGYGNVISGNDHCGIRVVNSSRVSITRNMIGTNAAGSAGAGNQEEGVRIDGGELISVGGAIDNASNVISGNSSVGVHLTGGRLLVWITGNTIGPDASGTAAIGNGTGILISDAWGNRIGGENGVGGNVISGNTYGIYLTGSSTSDNMIIGNRIGTDASATSAIPNTNGIYVTASASGTIGGTGLGYYNIISGNSNAGVYIASDAGAATVMTNYIGTNLLGNGAVGNTYGIRIDGSSGHLIGGSAPGAGNLVSGNSGSGILVSGSLPSGSNRIEGNRIGTTGSGSAPLPNGNGIEIDGATNTLIGGSAVGTGNTISGNRDHGIYIHGTTATGSVIRGNRIGRAATGFDAVPNGSGIHIVSSAANTIGGTTADDANIIAFNAGDGVDVEGVASTGNSIRRNSMYSNTDLGIDLLLGNNSQSSPTLASATSASSSNLAMTYSVPATAGAAYPLAIEFFTADADGEGMTYVGEDSYATAGTTRSVSFVPAGSVTPGAYRIVATATDANGNTSEFSSSVVVTEPVVVTAPNGGEAFCAGSATTIAWASSGFADARIDLSGDGGANWTTIVASTPAASGSYTWTIPTTLAAGTDYRIRVSNVLSATAADQSDASFTINTPPAAIITSSAFPTTTAFDDVTITSSATGTPAPAVQWERKPFGGSFAPIPGATSSTLTLEDVTMADHLSAYHAVYTNSCGTSTSMDVLLQVSPAPLSVVADSKAMQCGGAMPTLTGNVSGAQNGETFTVAYATAPATSGPGSYAIVPSITGGADPSNYTITYTNGALTISDGLAPVPTIATLPALTGQCSVSEIVAPTATDQCAGTITATTSDPLSYAAQGTYTIHWIYTDPSGNSETQNQTIVVLDNTAPTLTVSLGSTTLWPPNNQMRTIDVTASVSDNCGNGSGRWVLASVTGDDGTVAADISAATGTAATSFQVRAKRTGTGNGRTYTATFTATDAAGNTTTRTATVFVPHDQSAKPTVENVVTGQQGLASLSVPNPFTTATEIRYTLSEAGHVRVRVMDISGRQVATLVDAEAKAGGQIARWNGEDMQGGMLPAGTYLYVIEAGGRTESGPMVLTR